MTPHAWDRVIDDVARDMTAAAPAEGFRARVMERVTTTPRARLQAAFAWTWRGATLAAAVAVAAIALGINQPFRGPEPQPSVARVSPASAPVAAPADPATTVVGPAPVTAARRAPAPRPSPDLIEWRARNIPALADVAALDMEPIQPAGLSISQLSVTPLDIAPIVISSIARIDGQR